MKKYTKFAYIIIILLILLFGFFIYKVSGKNGNNEDIKEKSLSEIKYLEGKLSDLFNQLNNINFDRYTISVSEIKETEKQSSSSSGKSGESSKEGKQSEGGEGSESSGSSEGNSNTSESTEDSSKEENKQYKLEETGILTQDTEINWKQIKNDVEKIYVSLYPTTLDLYQTSNNKDDIVNFNKEYDNLTIAVKEENKENTLKELSLLYDYLPKFIENSSSEEKDKALVKTKNNIFKAYSLLEQEDWNSMSEYTSNAIQEFTKLITNVSNPKNRNQYNINKAYIMINELQNAIVLKDKDVFLIKYKNLLEELQNI